MITAGVALAAATAGLAEPSGLREKRAQAEEVRAQIAQIDARLGLAIEAYNGATVRLDGLRAQIETNRQHLKTARRANEAAQRNLEQRLVALYTGGDPSILEIVLGAASLDELLDRLDSAQRISAQDVRIVGEIRRSRAEIAAREERLEQAERAQQDIVAERAAKKSEIEGELAQREALYESVKDEIDRLEAAERERQRRIEEQLRQEQQERERIREAGGVDTGQYQGQISTPEGIGTSPGSAIGERAVQIAMQYLGIPYLWGGASPSSGFDCSGLTMYVYAQLGIQLPHYAASQYTMGVAISRDQLQPGDLVFFHGLGHMGMYIGGGQFIHAPRTGDVVKISSINDPWYVSTWVGARRIT